MKRIKQIVGLYKSPAARSIGIYTFTNFFAKAVSFLLLFIYTNPLYITPSENGILNLMATTTLFLMPFVALGTVHSINADFFKLKPEEFRNNFTSSLTLPIFTVLLSAFGLWIFYPALERNYNFPLSFIWIIPTIVLFNYINEHLLNLVRNNNEPRRFLAVNVVKTVLEMSLSVILVVSFAWRWQGRVAGILVAYGIVFLYAIYYFRQKGYLFGKVKKEYIISDIQYAIPIVLMQAGIFSMSASDKFFLSAFTNDNNATLGIYSIASIFATVVNILGTAVLHYFLPRVYTELSANNINYRNIKRYFFLYAGIMVVFYLALVTLSPIAYKWFIHEKYHSALPLIPFLAGGSFLWAISYFFYSSMLFQKDKKKILTISILSIIISLSLYYFFIREMLTNGAAYANITGYGLCLFLTLWINRKYVRKIFGSENNTHTGNVNGREGGTS